MNTYYKTKRKVCRLKWHRANGIVILQTDINSYPNRYRFTNDHFLFHNVLCKHNTDTRRDFPKLSLLNN